MLKKALGFLLPCLPLTVSCHSWSCLIHLMICCQVEIQCLIPSPPPNLILSLLKPRRV